MPFFRRIGSTWQIKNNVSWKSDVKSSITDKVISDTTICEADSSNKMEFYCEDSELRGIPLST